MSLNFEATIFHVTQDQYGFIQVSDIKAKQCEEFYIVVGGKFVDKTVMNDSDSEWFDNIDLALSIADQQNEQLIQLYNERAYLTNRGNTMLEQKYVYA